MLCTLHYITSHCTTLSYIYIYMYIYITYNPHDTLFQAHPDMFRATRNLSFGGALQRSRTVTAEAGVSPTSKVCIASRG